MINPGSNSPKNSGTSSKQAASAIEGTPWHRLHLWQFQTVRDALVIVGLVFVIACGYWLRSITVPILVGLALAYLVEPIVKSLTRRHRWLSRQGVAGGLVGLFGLAFLLLVIAVVPLLVRQTLNLIEALPQTVDRVSTLIEQRIPEELRLQLFGPAETAPADDQRDEESRPRGPQAENSSGASETSLRDDQQEGEGATSKESGHPFDPEHKGQLATQIENWIRDNITNLLSGGIEQGQNVVAKVTAFVGRVLYLLMLLVLVPFFFYVFSTSWPAVERFGSQLIPRSSASQIRDLLTKMDRAVSGFVRGRIVVCAIVGILLALGWWACGVPFWLPVGLLTGAFFVIPFLSVLGWPVAVALLWIAQSEQPVDQRMAAWAILTWPSVVYVVVQVLESYLLTPVIVGRTTNLSPVWIIVAILAGGILMGLYGMLLAIPAMACLKILMTDVLMPRVKEWTEGKVADILPIGND